MFDPSRYNWEVRKVQPQELAKTLDNIPQGWEVFAILTYGQDFVVVVRRPV